LFSKFSSCSTQNTDSTLFYEKLGIKKTNYTGNLKFALTPDLTDAKKYDELKVLAGDRKIFLAASTHPGEEEIISRVTLKLKKTCKELLTIVVPRHPTRNNIINKNIIKNTAIRSMGNKIKRNTHIYLADTIGELNLFYKLADIIFIGGSLVMHGGQNPIEAAYHGKKVYHGKHVENFSDVYMTLDQMKLSQVVNNERQLEHFIHEEYKSLDKAVRKVDISSLQKEGEETVKKVLKEIYQYL
jgi:3-deoxy-D-manno-octulosonic-acid transferase